MSALVLCQGAAQETAMKRFYAFFRKSLLWVLFLPYIVQGIGMSSNQLVLFANHDKFPVMCSPAKENQFRNDAAKAIEKAQDEGDELAALEITQDVEAGMLDDTHCLMTSETHLNLLADIFDMHNAVYSIGDFFLMLSEFLSFCPYVWLGLLLKKCWDADAI